MSFGQLLRILWARRSMVMVITAFALVIALVASLVLPKKYVAVASVVVDSRGVDPVTGNTLTTQSAQNLLSTQADVIMSRAVAGKVVENVGLVKTAEGEDADDARTGAVNSLLRHLTVKPGADSNVIRIQFEHGDAKTAAKIANAFASAYMATSLELKLDPAKQQSSWFEEQLQSLRSSLEAQRQNLSEYQRANGIVATDDKLDVENAKLEELAKQLLIAQRDSDAASARLRQTNQAVQDGRVDELPDVLGSPLLQTLKAEEMRAEGKLAELSERFDKNHPAHQAAAAEVRSVRAKIDAQTRNTQGSATQSSQIASRQVAELQRSYDLQKVRILELRKQRDELAVRSREMESAQAAYDSALQRASQVRLESQLSQTSVAILDRASAPIRPATLGIGLAAVLAIVFGALLGSALALLLEMLDRRLRARDELSDLLGIEVLAEVPRLKGSFRPARIAPIRGQRATLDVKPA